MTDADRLASLEWKRYCLHCRGGVHEHCMSAVTYCACDHESTPERPAFMA